MGNIERRDTPENERMAAMQEAGWPDVVWHQRDDGLRAFVRVSDADERLRGAVDAETLERHRWALDAAVRFITDNGGNPDVVKSLLVLAEWGQ